MEHNLIYSQSLSSKKPFSTIKICLFFFGFLLISLSGNHEYNAVIPTRSIDHAGIHIDHIKIFDGYRETNEIELIAMESNQSDDLVPDNIS